jgi:hypothetical protein
MRFTGPLFKKWSIIFFILILSDQSIARIKCAIDLPKNFPNRPNGGAGTSLEDNREPECLRFCRQEIIVGVIEHPEWRNYAYHYVCTWNNENEEGFQNPIRGPVSDRDLNYYLELLGKEFPTRRVKNQPNVQSSNAGSGGRSSPLRTTSLEDWLRSNVPAGVCGMHRPQIGDAECEECRKDRKGGSSFVKFVATNSKEELARAETEICRDNHRICVRFSVRGKTEDCKSFYDFLNEQQNKCPNCVQVEFSRGG